MKEFLQQEFYYNTISEWAFAIGILVASFIIAKLIYWIFGNLIKRIATRTKSRIDDIIVDTFQQPIVFGLTIFGLWYGMRQLMFPENINHWINNVYHILIVITITWLIARLVDAILREYLIPLAEKSESDMDDQLIPVVRKGLRAGIWILGIIVALNNAGYDVAALIAGLGIGGLALALAAKETIANIFGGITVFTDKPFKINDRIKIGGFDGTIVEIGIRVTRLKTLEGRIVTIPNSKFTGGMVENVSLEPSRKVVLNIGLVYDTPTIKMEKAMELLKEIAAANTNLDEGTVVGFNNFGDSSLGIIFVYFIKKEADILVTQSEINLAIMKQFEEHGLEMAYPTRTVYNKTV
jgi:MscS family membrane protein